MARRPVFTPEEQAAADEAHRRACREHAQRAGRDDAARMGAPLPNRFISVEWQGEYETAFYETKKQKEAS